MLRLLLVMLLAFAPSVKPIKEGSHVEYCDLIEVNSHISENGRHMYDQIIFWEWSPELKRMIVCSWCLVGDDKSYPVKIGNRYKYTRRLSRNRSIIIYTDMSISTSSKLDPERDNKNIFPEKYRRDLFRGKR